MPTTAMLIVTKIAVGTSYEMTTTEAMLYALLAFTLLLLFAILLLAWSTVRALNSLAEAREIEKAVAAGKPVPAKSNLSLWAQLDRKYFTNAVPLELEYQVVMDHDYDGIKELDNHLPPWWTGLFFATIGFAVVYLLVFHVWNQAPLQAEELAIEQKEAVISIAAYKAKQADAIDENSVKLLKDDKTLADGKTIFDNNCKVCHGAEGQGGVGPNLTDEFWIHGGSIKDMFKTIKEGVPQKGMISWKATLKPGDMQAVVSYILVSIQGKNPAGAKAPQGDRYIPEKPANAAPAKADIGVARPQSASM